MYHERPSRPRSDYYKELAWALFLINLILALVALLLSQFLGGVLAVGLFLGTGGMVTAALLLVVGVNAAAYRIHDWWIGRRPPR